VGHAKTVSKPQFWIVTALLTIIFLLAELSLMELVFLELDLPTLNFPSFIFVLLGADFLLSFFAAERFFKTLGLSRSGNSVETWDRIGANHDRIVADEEVVEFKEPVSHNIFGFVFFLVFGLFSMLGILYSHVVGVHPAQLVFWHVAGVLFGGCAIQLALASDGCWVRADQRGVFGYPARYALHRKLLYWSKIATCDIVTRHDPFGTPYLIVPVFRNEFGQKLMSSSLHGIPMECQMRLVKYIKTKLPKARVEFAEL
jgi:hypothetical protein